MKEKERRKEGEGEKKGRRRTREVREQEGKSLILAQINSSNTNNTCKQGEGKVEESREMKLKDMRRRGKESNQGSQKRINKYSNHNGEGTM